MKIKSIETFSITVPLKQPFKTALRTVTKLKTIIVKITLEDGTVGYGEAPPTHVITGETKQSIEACIHEVLKPLLVGKSIHHLESLFDDMKRSIVGNSSAKAAVDIALYDCFAQLAEMPLYQLLGGWKNSIETDYTVSVNEPDLMAQHASNYINQGFNILKIKVGKDTIHQDIERIQTIREHVGHEPNIRLDANQGWSVKEAIYAINHMEDLQLNIELIEQPVPAHDIKGLKQVTQHTHTPIMADESVFSLYDAKGVLELGAADLINIKLMKSGGIHEALKIVRLAEAYNVECMVGSMIETKLGITAASHLAASQKNITRYDFDAPLMLSHDVVDGGVYYDKNIIHLPDQPGLGINFIKESMNSYD
ncbi:dipeptide epimerase [Filobacillus milosensis]|uniref:Dipeptide epimerase n=1 Tax=Filobacillus milosensis TaxID=94137 RepID=A0A4Y8IMP7_9BACI|nr:dipeptide epimerase [Filobacillus milosensis]TFB21076.1 dipeptide epimerase [Filobacillus milosensis]